jgi:hypothetical protein
VAWNTNCHEKLGKNVPFFPVQRKNIAWTAGLYINRIQWEDRQNYPIPWVTGCFKMLVHPNEEKYLISREREKRKFLSTASSF